MINVSKLFYIDVNYDKLNGFHLVNADGTKYYFESIFKDLVFVFETSKTKISSCFESFPSDQNANE